MPCGQKCKEILDGAVAVMAAVSKAVGCMTNSVVLAAVHDVEVPSAELVEFRHCAEELAKAASAVSAAIKLP